MARLVQIAIALSLTAGAGWAQAPPNPSPSPWQVTVAGPKEERSFDLASTGANQHSPYDPSGRVVAGRELLPDGTVGFGMFGEETPGSVQSRTTVRDYTLTPARKPAIGLSLKF